MKQLFKILVAMSLVAFAASTMAVSCGKTPDAGGGNNNNSGGGNAVKATIEITDVATDLVKITDGTNIKLKVGAFPINSFADYNQDFDRITNAAADRRKKAFDVEMKGATGGLLFAVKGNIPSIVSARMITPAPVATIPAGAAGDDGLHAVVTAAAAGYVPAGLNFFGVFANKTAPANTAEVAADVDPFAFSLGADSIQDSHPVFWCVATIPGITAAATASSTLEGGQKASCYVSSRGDRFFNIASADWFGEPQPFKRKIKVRFFGIQTDKKPITEIGLPATDDAAKVAAFNNGLNAFDMAGLVTENNDDTTAVEIEVVKDADF